MNLSGFTRVAACVAAALAVACGPTAPSPMPAAGEVWPPSDHWAADLPQITAAIVEEFRVLGLDVVPAERFGGSPFGAGAQRLGIASVPDESIYLHVYRTAEQARSEASRIQWDGNLAPESGHVRVMVDYASTMHFHHRDRVIAKFGGCDATVKAAMTTIFGPPIVVTSATCWKLRPSGDSNR